MPRLFANRVFRRNVSLRRHSAAANIPPIWRRQLLLTVLGSDRRSDCTVEKN